MAHATLAELEAVYRHGYARFVRVATAVTGDEQTAHDAVHDGFVRAVRHRDRWDGSGPLAGWIWRIVVNAALRLAVTRPLAVDLEPAAASTNGREPDDHVRALVAALPERQRLVLFLRYYADLDYEAIAAALDVRPGTVSATLHAAHAALRRQLQEVPR
jgi:RNA polymerase sigma-70 factor, ECF subfamily